MAQGFDKLGPNGRWGPLTSNGRWGLLSPNGQWGPFTPNECRNPFTLSLSKGPPAPMPIKHSNKAYAAQTDVPSPKPSP